MLRSSSPASDLINVRGVLYGTTTVGGGAEGCGSVGWGTVFKTTTAARAGAAAVRFSR